MKTSTRIAATDRSGWTEWHESTRLVDAEYVAKLEAMVFRFGDGRIFGVPLHEFQGADATPVRRVSLAFDGDAAVIEQFSGNRLEVPWDVVLCHVGRRSQTGEKRADHPASEGCEKPVSSMPRPPARRAKTSR